MTDLIENHYWWTLVVIAAAILAVCGSAGLALSKVWPDEPPDVEIREYADGTTCYIRHDGGIAGDSISCVKDGQ